MVSGMAKCTLSMQQVGVALGKVDLHIMHRQRQLADTDDDIMICAAALAPAADATVQHMMNRGLHGPT